MSAIGCIRYQTEGKTLVECETGSGDPCAFIWLKGSTRVKVHQGGGGVIELSKSQLVQIAQLATAIAEDLIAPGESK